MGLGLGLRLSTLTCIAKKLRKASMSESSVLGPHERVVLPSSETWLG